MIYFIGKLLLTLQELRPLPCNFRKFRFIENEFVSKSQYNSVTLSVIHDNDSFDNYSLFDFLMSQY